MSELEDVLRRAEAKLDEKDYALVKALAESYAYLSDLVGSKNASISRLRKLLFGSKTEKTAAVVVGGKEPEVPPPEDGGVEPFDERGAKADAENESANPRPGHGRNGADAYVGAEKVEVPHESLQPGDSCPECQKGTVYETGRPGVLVRIVGQAPLAAKVYELQKLRCNLCGKVFTARAPEGVGGEKYDATAGSMISLLKYGSGMPFNRTERLEGSVGIPLPASTQWDIVHSHGRRQFVDMVEQFPEECRHVLEALKVIYHNDAVARERNLSPEARLEFHQANSGPTMEELRVWLARQFDEHLVEPNSGLGGAIAYLLKHWEKLTLFLRVPGAPLDNNVCERALKKAILHRKNALFYKTENGARVGDLFMSLIYTCELCGESPFDYLTALDRHAIRAATHPADWMPWNYRQTLERMKHVQTPSEESQQDERHGSQAAQGAGEAQER